MLHFQMGQMITLHVVDESCQQDIRGPLASGARQAVLSTGQTGHLHEQEQEQEQDVTTATRKRVLQRVHSNKRGYRQLVGRP
jgi:hypothetical protein